MTVYNVLLALFPQYGELSTHSLLRVACGRLAGRLQPWRLLWSVSGPGIRDEFQRLVCWCAVGLATDVDNDGMTTATMVLSMLGRFVLSATALLVMTDCHWPEINKFCIMLWLKFRSRDLFLADGRSRLCYSVASVCRLFVTLCIVAKRCVQEFKLLLTNDRKSYMRNRLIPKWTTLTFV